MNSLMKRSHQLQQFLRSNRFLVKSFCTAVTESNIKEKFCYEDFIRGRQAEAERSIVVQVSSEKSFPELYNYCSAYGNIVNAQHYRIYHEDDTHYILLEYSSAQEAAAAIDATSYNDELQGVPVRSPFLWFKATQGKAKKQLKTNEKLLSCNKSLQVVEGTRLIENNDLHALLQAAPCIETQIKLLYQHTQLNDLGVRMRFLAALQLQSALSGMFPQANAQPFGSSVNGFGKMGCDLDLILRFDREPLGEVATRRHESRLVFHTKENLNNGRSQVQRQMESISDIMQLFLPGVCHVRRILQARVPIIKYHHEHLNLEVDLSMSNLTGFYMSELLYMFGELDERVRPLTFCIRRWAQSCGLTNPSPGRWISNFSLTCLVIFFLQQLKLPILPSINALTKSAKKQDIRITEDGVNCTFARDMESIGFQSSNTSAINELMLQFFEFYSQFDFQNRALSLNEGRTIPKPDHSAIYIVNPLEQVLNVSKNISLEECERLRIEVRNAAWVLESEVENPALPENAKLESPWGLLNLFKINEKSIIRPNMFFKPRMVDINELFEKKNSETASKATTATNETPTTKTTPIPTAINLKNDSVRQAVQSIKTQARSDLKQLRMKSSSSAKVAKVEGAKGRRR